MAEDGIPALMSTYARLPVAFERGEGPWLWDVDGRRYIDGLSGLAVCGLGHAHPEIAAAIADQAGRLVHTSNLYRIDLQERLGERLIGLSGMERVFFCNSGAEANEAAIKVARALGHRRGIQCPRVVVAEGSFHGRTMATLSATGNPKVHAGFEPLVDGFVHVPYDDLEAVGRAGDEASGEVVAVLLEPILGEGGIVTPSQGYLSGIRRLCDARGWLMMLDEIQTGNGRTGRWFAWQHEEAIPDVVTLAKGLANGVPIGACLARAQAAEVLGPGSHGSTFGGNPLACRAALAVLDVMERDRLCERAKAMGQRLVERLKHELAGVSAVVAVRGRGLMIGVELDRPCADVVRLALERGLLLNVTAQRIVRLLPPLVIGESEADAIARLTAESVRAFLDSGESG